MLGVVQWKNRFPTTKAVIGECHVALVTVSQFLGLMGTRWGRIALLVPLRLEVTRLSLRHLGHLCRQVGSVQAHMRMGGSVTLRPEEEIAQLSINFTRAHVHFGHLGFGISLPFLPYQTASEDPRGPIDHERSRRVLHGPTGKDIGHA